MAGRQFNPQALTAQQIAFVCKVVSDAQLLEPTDRASTFRDHISQNADNVETKRKNVVLSLLADLADQGWEITTDGRIPFVTPSQLAPQEHETVEQAKARARKGLQRSSNRQLAQASVTAFIALMERRRKTDRGQFAITDLVDDGTELAMLLGSALAASNDERQAVLSKIVRPYVVECGADEQCPITGLNLQDIWRYFRHTWSLEYNPLPGRTLRLLIRNAARPNHPVIGIAMLASPAANLYVRDEWIQWRSAENLIPGLIERRWKPENVGRLLLSVLRAAIEDIRTDDLIDQSEIENPTDKTFFVLDQITAISTAQRGNDLTQRNGDKLVDIRDVDKASVTADQWRQLSETSLYRKKRAEQLKPLLMALRELKEADFEKAPRAAIYEALLDEQGRRAINVALNELKKRKLATEVTDVAVCGAVAPYNHLLGGKLVALLMGSQNVRDIYKRRYGGQVSEIASQLAGRPIIRPAELKVLTTTSLYGVGGNQYSAAKVTIGDYSALKSEVRWRKLASTTGFTVTHISQRTVGLMRDLAVTAYGRRRINSVFGEGSSPRTRQIREGLNLIGINNDDVLRQSVGRRVYALELFPNARDALTGLDPKAKVRKGPSTSAISKAWIKRWLIPRIEKPNIVDAVSKTKSSDIAYDLHRRIREGRKQLGTLEGELPFNVGSGEITE